MGSRHRWFLLLFLFHGLHGLDNAAGTQTVGPKGHEVTGVVEVGDAAGKTMTVQVPENSGFWVYDGNGQVTASSVLWGDTTVTLPEDGTIVFAGDPGARFHLRFQG